MDARNRVLPEWFNRIRTRQLTLPRFQRSEAWGHKEVTGLLTSVLRGLPSGAALILEVGDKEKFESRTMVDAPSEGDRVAEQLLDGQQRLTALWRSLNDKYEDRTYFVNLDMTAQTEMPDENDLVIGIARWKKNGIRYPMWADSPQDCLTRQLIPISLVHPDDIQKEIRKWLAEAIPNDHDYRNDLFDTITTWRDKVKAFNLPYLALPPTTPKEIALDVFVKMNTSSVKLSLYDITVALVEDETGNSLRDLMAALNNTIPRAADYADLKGIVLDTVALRQGRAPNQAGHWGIDREQMVKEWDFLTKGIKYMVGLLEEEGIFDAQRLPSSIPLPVIAALWEHMPVRPDAHGNALSLIKQYIWRSFLTPRYEQSSATNAFQDFKALRDCLKGTGSVTDIPIFDNARYPAPAKELILNAAWPKNKNIFSRGLLALQMKCGAKDLADGKVATVATITSKQFPREYHHLYPESILRDAGVPGQKIYRAVNCALLTWSTNRTISNKLPKVYLTERIANCSLGETEIKRRLKSHLIPYTTLAVNYDGLTEDEIKSCLPTDYEAFSNERAEILEQAATAAIDGKPFNDIMDDRN